MCHVGNTCLVLYLCPSEWSWRTVTEDILGERAKEGRRINGHLSKIRYILKGHFEKAILKHKSRGLHVYFREDKQWNGHL